MSAAAARQTNKLSEKAQHFPQICHVLSFSISYFFQNYHTLCVFKIIFSFLSLSLIFFLTVITVSFSSSKEEEEVEINRNISMPHLTFVRLLLISLSFPHCLAWPYVSRKCKSFQQETRQTSTASKLSFLPTHHVIIKNNSFVFRII